MNHHTRARTHIGESRSRRTRHLVAILTVIAMVLSSIFVITEPASAASGDQLGPAFGVFRSNINSEPQAITVAPDGTVHVGWSKDASSFSDLNALFVSAYDGTDWVPLGGVPLNEGAKWNAEIEDMEIDSLGRPVVAWRSTRARFGDQLLRVARFEAGAWTVLGTELNVDPDGSANQAHLEIDQFDNPVIAWNEPFGPVPDAGYVARWDGAQWNLMGDPLPYKLYDLEVGSRNNGTEVIYIATEDTIFGGPDVIVVHRWNEGGDRWVTPFPDITPVDPDALFTIFVDIELQKSGAPFVYWTEGALPSLVPHLVRIRAGQWRTYETTGLVGGSDFDIQGNARPVIGGRTYGELTVGFDQFSATGGATPTFVPGVWNEPNNGSFDGIRFVMTTFGREVYIATWDRNIPGSEQLIVRKFFNNP